MADNKFNYLNWYWRESSLLIALNIQYITYINLIQADLEANDQISAVARGGPPPFFFTLTVKTDLYKMLKIKYYQATVWEVFKK